MLICCEPTKQKYYEMKHDLPVWKQVVAHDILLTYESNGNKYWIMISRVPVRIKYNKKRQVLTILTYKHTEFYHVLLHAGILKEIY